MDEYTILSVQDRDEWGPVHGSMMKDYAIQVQKAGNASPEQGWIKLTQKVDTRPPRDGETLHGIIETKQNSNGNSYKKFKKMNPDYQGNRSGGFGVSGGSQAPSNSSEIASKLDYVVKMLEELTGRRDVVHDVGQSSSSPEEPLEDPFEGLL